MNTIFLRLAGIATMVVMFVTGPTWDSPTGFERFAWNAVAATWNILFQIMATQGNILDTLRRLRDTRP